MYSRSYISQWPKTRARESDYAWKSTHSRYRYLQENFEFTAHQRHHRGERLNDQVSDDCLFLEIPEETIHTIPHKYFHPFPIYVLLLLTLVFSLPFFQPFSQTTVVY